jgi:hypothetical protein
MPQNNVKIHSKLKYKFYLFLIYLKQQHNLTY